MDNLTVHERANVNNLEKLMVPNNNKIARIVEKRDAAIAKFEAEIANLQSLNKTYEDTIANIKNQADLRAQTDIEEAVYSEVESVEELDTPMIFNDPEIEDTELSPSIDDIFNN